jgi:acyl carrier protein
MISSKKVQKSEFLIHLSEMVEISPNTLTGGEKLEDLEGWTSLAMISFIAFADEHFGKTLSPRQFASCGTVEDLSKLVGVDSTSPVTRQ